MKPFAKVIDLKGKTVIVRVMGSKQEIMEHEDFCQSFFRAGAVHVAVTNHLVDVDVWSDEDLKKVGLRRING